VNRIKEHYPVFELRANNCENLARYIVDSIRVRAVLVPPVALSRWFSLGNLPLQHLVPPSPSYEHDSTSLQGPWGAAGVCSADKLFLVYNIALMLLDVFESKQPSEIGSETEYYGDSVMKLFQEPEMADSTLPRRLEIWVLPHDLGQLAYNSARAVILLFQYFTDDYIEKAWSQAIKIFSRLLRLNGPASGPHPQEKRRDAVSGPKDNIADYTTNNLFISYLPVVYIERGDQHQQQGRLKDACEVYKEGLFNAEGILGDDHLDTLKTIECLAETYNDLGETPKALDLHEKVLVTRKRIFGKEHADTLKSMNNVAETNVKLGEMAQALNIWEETSLG